MNVIGLQMQRDQALACMILAICLSVTAFLSVFGTKEKQAIEKARNVVAVHEELYRQSIEVLDQNQRALNSVQAALDEIEAPHKR
jgi:hypothetical protein